MTPHYVETPNCGEASLVTNTGMDQKENYYIVPAGDVLGQCKHVPTFGIFIGLDVSTMNISLGLGAKTARTRSLDWKPHVLTLHSISPFIMKHFLTSYSLKAGLWISPNKSTKTLTIVGPPVQFQESTAKPALTPHILCVPFPGSAYIQTSSVMVILSVSLLRMRCLMTASMNIMRRISLTSLPQWSVTALYTPWWWLWQLPAMEWWNVYRGKMKVLCALIIVLPQLSWLYHALLFFQFI